MSGLDIIALPGHPGMFARRVAVEAWEDAGSPTVTSAGRLYAAQKELWDGWQQRLPGFNPADNPDNEWMPLAHVRFVAFDINPTADRIRRLKDAGFVRPYAFEPWHWELPNVRSYSIVRSIPATAGGDITPIIEQEEEDDMEPKIIGHEGQEVAVLAPWLPNGYLTEKLGTELAVGWSRLYSPTKDGLVPMYDRATYLGMIGGAKALAEGYQQALPKPVIDPAVLAQLLAAALTGMEMPGAGASKADVDAAADRVEAAIPTAEQNGQAARTALGNALSAK